MYTFNLCPLHSTINHKSNAGTSMPSKLNTEECSIKRLKEQIAQILALKEDSFDIYYQGVQLSGEEKTFTDYELENEDQLVIVPRSKSPNESLMATSAGLPSMSELHQSSKTIEKSATPNEFHRLYWLMKTPEFWRRITQALPELLLDSSALGLCEDSVLFCQNYNVTRLTETVQANPLLYKAVAQVIKEWTSSSGNGSHDGQLSPAAYFLNGSPHLIEQMAPRQPTVNVMPRRITNEDFLRALERTNRATTAAASQPTMDPVPTPPAARPSNRRNVISMDQLRSVLQRTSTPAAPVTTMDTTNNEPANVQALLDQMRAMGLTDEAANRQALEATQWDLKAALDLLLG